MMASENDRRVFRAHLLGAIAEAEEKVGNLDVGDADHWHENLRDIFMATNKTANMALNAMNAEVVRRRSERKKEKG